MAQFMLMFSGVCQDEDSEADDSVWLNLLWQGFHRRLAGKLTEGGGAGGSIRLGGRRKDVASALQQEGEEVSCRNSEVELWVVLDPWQICQNPPAQFIYCFINSVCLRPLGSHKKPQILKSAYGAQMMKTSVENQIVEVK